MIHPLKTEKNLSQEDSRKDTMNHEDKELFRAKFDEMITALARARARAETGSEKADLDEIAALLTVLAETTQGRLVAMTLDGLQIELWNKIGPVLPALGADVTIIDLWDTLQIQKAPPF